MHSSSMKSEVDGTNKHFDQVFENKLNSSNETADEEEHKRNEKDAKTVSLDSGKILRTTTVVVGVCQGCFFIYVSLLPYLSRTYGMNPVAFGYLQSGAALLQLAISPLVGRFGDAYGARAVLLLSAISTAFGHVTLGFASSVSMLIVSRSMTVTQDIRLGAQMMISDLVSGSERGISMGKLMLPMMIGMLAGPALAGQLAKLFGAQESLLITWVAPVMCVLAILINIPTVTCDEKHSKANACESEEKPTMLSLMRQTPVPMLMATKVLTAIPFMTLAQSLGVIGMTEFKLTPQMNGLVLSYNGVIGVIISAFILGKLSMKYTEDQLMHIAPIFLVAAYFLLSQTHSIWMLLLVMIPWNIGNAILDNQIISRLTRAAPAGTTGLMVGLNASLFQLARIVAPVLGGYLVHNLGFQSIGFLGMLLSICLTALLWICMPQITKENIS